jgi:glycosyltransferase involved in cell wall biosynthesis
VSFRCRTGLTDHEFHREKGFAAFATKNRFCSSVSMLISVVVPFHNVEPYIAACLDALAAADYPRDRFELIFVDNNSTDGSADIVRRYPQVRLLSEPAPGAYAARNRGVSASRGSIVAFTDSDCAPDRDWLARIESALNVPGVLLVQGSQRFARESLTLSLLSDYENAKAAHVFSSGAPEIYYAYTNNMAVRRELVDRVGPFAEVMRGGDVLFMQKAIAASSCGAIQYRPEIRVRHLEITSARRWFQKLRIYGESLRAYGTVARARPLNLRERLQIVRATVQRGRYSPVKSAVLLTLLIAGALFYEIGRKFPGSR